MLTITKMFNFCYAHFLPDYDGKCKDIHGHNAKLEIEINGSGTLHNYDVGMIFDFSKLKYIVNERIIDILDHKFINSLEQNNKRSYCSSSQFKMMIETPTAELMVKWIVYELQKVFDRDLIRVRLYETNDSYCEWKKQ